MSNGQTKIYGKPKIWVISFNSNACYIAIYHGSNSIKN